MNIKIDNLISRDLEWVGERQNYKYEAIARCNSPFCKDLVKKVSINTIFCPDCEYALIWSRRRLRDRGAKGKED